MCLGVPMRITEISGFNARCEARGIERKANLFLLQHEDLQVGDLVMIHVGNAIQKMTEEDAQTAWDLYDEIFEAEAAGPGMGSGVDAGANPGLGANPDVQVDSAVGTGPAGDRGRGPLLQSGPLRQK